MYRYKHTRRTRINKACEAVAMVQKMSSIRSKCISIYNGGGGVGQTSQLFLELQYNLRKQRKPEE